MAEIKDQYKPNLYQLFSHVEDKRRKQGQLHSIEVILMIATMAIMSGYSSVRAMGDFVKRNKKLLYNQVVFNILNDLDLDTVVKTEKNRGRDETRIVSVSGNIKGIDTEWVGVKSIIQVVRSVIRKGKESQEIAYYISSLPKSVGSDQFYQYIRRPLVY